MAARGAPGGCGCGRGTTKADGSRGPLAVLVVAALSPVVSPVVTIKLEKSGQVVSFRGRGEREIILI